MPQNLNSRIGIFVLGLTAVVLQVTVARWAFVLFYGTEISLGLVFFIWFLAEAAGVFIALHLRRFFADFSSLALVFYTFSLLLLIVSPSVFFLRGFLALAAGEISIFKGALAAALVLAFPFSFGLGFIFLLVSNFTSEQEEEKIAYSYLFESLGFGLGGIFLSFFLIKHFSFLETIFACALLNLLFSLFALPRNLRRKFSFFLLVGFVLLAAFVLKKEGVWQKRLLPGYKILATANSIYGYDILAERQGQYAVFNNANLVTSFPNKLAAEESVHIPLLEYPQAENILVVGSPNPDLLAELKKYRHIKEVDFVELDPKISALVQNLAAWQRQKYKACFKVKIYNCDIRYFLKRKANFRFYDCVLIAYGMPYNLLLNRFFTKEFFLELKKSLRQKSLVSFFLPASETYLNPQQILIINSLAKTLAAVFPQVLVLPGSYAHFLAGQRIKLSSDWQILEKRRKSLGIKTAFINKYFLFDRLSRQRLAFFARQRKKLAAAFLNTDFWPLMYFLGFLLLASSSFYSLPFVPELNAALLLSFLPLFILAFYLLARRKEKMVLGLLAAWVGFCQIGLQLLIIIYFQITFGYIYYQLSFLVPLFMLGFSAGNFWGKKQKKRGAFSGQSSVLWLAFLALGWFFFQPKEVWFYHLIFWSASFSAGFFGGIISVSGTAAFLKSGSFYEALAFWYGGEILGSSAGAFLVVSLLVPLFGLRVCALALVEILFFAFFWAKKAKI